MIIATALCKSQPCTELLFQLTFHWKTFHLHFKTTDAFSSNATGNAIPATPAPCEKISKEVTFLHITHSYILATESRHAGEPHVLLFFFPGRQTTGMLFSAFRERYSFFLHIYQPVQARGVLTPWPSS